MRQRAHREISRCPGGPVRASPLLMISYGVPTMFLPHWPGNEFCAVLYGDYGVANACIDVVNLNNNNNNKIIIIIVIPFLILVLL